MIIYYTVYSTILLRQHANSAYFVDMCCLVHCCPIPSAILACIFYEVGIQQIELLNMESHYDEQILMP